MRKDTLNTVPLHELPSEAYLIAQHETTFGQWVDYLESLADEERVKGAASLGGKLGPVSFTRIDGDWLLKYRLNNHEHELHLNEAFSLPERKMRQRQDWRRLPMVGATVADIQHFLTWLQRAARLTRPRLCSELEWERAARGADGREYPHGHFLGVNEANFNETYGKKPATAGPDEVGSHPESRSPFGIDDMSGNAWEFTRSSLSDGYVMRGGDFHNSRSDVRSSNREVIPPTVSHFALGFRVCADLAPSSY